MNVNKWYTKNIDRFPDLVKGRCPDCGNHPMMIDRGDYLECYHCGGIGR